MLIAFMGSAGSGKTTVARAVYKKLDEGQVDYIHHVSWLPAATATIFKKIWWAIKFWFYVDMAIFRTYLGFAWRNRDKWPKLKDRMYMSYIAPVFTYNLQQIAAGKHDILVYDTDIIVPHADSFEEERVVRFFTDVILPKVGQVLVVSVETPHDVAVARWGVRENKHLSEEEVAEMISERGIRKDNTDILLDTLKGVSGVEILCLSGVDNPEENADTVYRKMCKMMEDNSK